jgi:UDP:flavonoid glycosyltransferase YjiC (YdhE family)
MCYRNKKWLRFSGGYLHMKTPKKIILFFPFNLLSHYLRCLVLAKAYDPSEYLVYFISSNEYNDFVFKQGYEVFKAKQFDAAEVMRCSRNFDFSWLNRADLEVVMLDQVRVIRELKADMVIADMAPTLKMAAEITRVRQISLLNAYMTRHYKFTRKISRSHSAYDILQVFPEKLGNQLTMLGETFAFQHIQKAFNYLRKKYGLQKVKDYLSEIAGDETFICDLPVLFPLKPLPPTCKIVGPLIYDAARMDEHRLDEAILQRPVICICMGSTGDWDSLRFLNDNYYAKFAIITTGDSMEVLSASHIISFDFVNLDQVLRRSTLMICHGGNGTIYTGIKNRVFMLCLPSHFEQEWNVDALERIGYGKSAVDYDAEIWKIEIAKYASFSPTAALPELDNVIVFPE